MILSSYHLILKMFKPTVLQRLFMCQFCNGYGIKYWKLAHDKMNLCNCYLHCRCSKEHHNSLSHNLALQICAFQSILFHLNRDGRKLSQREAIWSESFVLYHFATDVPKKVLCSSYNNNADALWVFGNICKLLRLKNLVLR